MTDSTNIRSLNTKIERILSENKKGIKTYVSYEAADAKAGAMIESFLESNGFEGKAFDYAVLYVQGRFTPVFFMNSFFSRYNVGGYVGYFAAKGFMQA